MVRLPSITHRVEGPSQRISGRDSANIVLRRQDLAGETHASGPGKEMLPGIWEVWFTPAAGQVWEEITTSPPYIMSRARNRDRAGKLLSENAPRIGVDVGDSFAIHYKVSTTPGTIEGTVRHQSQPMAGAPVFLLANDAAVLQRIHGLRRTITGEDGRFRFSGLPTGSYSLLSSADLDEINKTVMQDYQAKSVTLTDGKSESIVLDLIVR